MGTKPIAIYGGTFAPVHNGHLAALKALADQTDVEKIYVVPTNIPPHKSVDFDDDPSRRMDMLYLAVGTLGLGERIAVSDYEISRRGTSYTFLTLTYFHENVSPDITFLCGGDMFVTLGQWKNADVIFRLAKIAYTCRPGFDLSGKADEYSEKFGARLVRLEMDPVKCSSTEIRRLAAEGTDVSAFTPKPVADYIAENRLYQKIS